MQFGFTPHARGSTPGRWRDGILCRVYPACAGIDRERLAWMCSPQGLPRMRGDRPSLPDIASSNALFTPHARGSTCSRPCVMGPIPVYPACAGIDPPRVWLLGGLLCLPRMRGDRPFVTKKRRSLDLFTPHARGSTSVATIVTHGSHVYPACAGIDLAQKTCTLV